MAAGRRAAIRSLPRFKGNPPSVLRAVLAHSRAMELGRLNNTVEVDLPTDGVTTSTVVAVRGVRSTTVADAVPQDANAAASRTTTFCVCTKDTITITHAPSVAARKYRIVFFA